MFRNKIYLNSSTNRAVFPIALSVETTKKYLFILFYDAFFTSGDDRQSLCVYLYKLFAK